MPLRVWTRCVDGLPQVGEAVLVTAIAKKGRPVVTVATLQGQEPWIYFRSFSQGRRMTAAGYADPRDDKQPLVTAWQRLPEPFRG